MLIMLIIIDGADSNAISILLSFYLIGFVIFGSVSYCLYLEEYNAQEAEYYYDLTMKEYNKHINEIGKIISMYPDSSLEVWKRNFRPTIYTGCFRAIRAKFYHNPNKDRCYFVINKSLWGDKALYECGDGYHTLLAEEDAEMLYENETLKVKDIEQCSSQEIYQEYILRTIVKHNMVDRQFIENKFNKCDEFLRNNTVDNWPRMYDACSLEFSERF